MLGSMSAISTSILEIKWRTVPLAPITSFKAVSSRPLPLIKFFHCFVSNLPLSVSVCSFVFFEFLVLFLCFFVSCVFSCLLVILVFWWSLGFYVLFVVDNLTPSRAQSGIIWNNFLVRKTTPLLWSPNTRPSLFHEFFTKFLCMIYQLN